MTICHLCFRCENNVTHFKWAICWYSTEIDFIEIMNHWKVNDCENIASLAMTMRQYRIRTLPQPDNVRWKHNKNNKWITLFSASTSGSGTTARYHSNHSELLAANEANKFMCIVIRAHFNDLQELSKVSEWKWWIGQQIAMRRKEYIYIRWQWNEPFHWNELYNLQRKVMYTRCLSTFG